MMKKPNCPVIAIEEHYWDPELAKHFTGPEAGRGNETDQRLFDLGSLRLKEMDEAGIDIQVLSHGAPSTQKLGADIAADLTRQVNDRLAKVCAANPKRFAAFAALPTVRPQGCGRRTRAHRHQARLQGRDAARHVERRVPRPQALLADLRARREARRADLFPPVAAASRR